MLKVTLKKLIDNYFLHILFSFSILSLTLVFLLKENLEIDYALGEHTLVIFIPFVLYSLWELLINKKKFNILLFLVFIIISFIPILAYLNNEIIHKLGDDSVNFIKSAKFMIDNNTLTFSNENNIYQHQPGISYFYALEILIFKNESRLLQILNIILFFIIFYNFKDKLIAKMGPSESLIFKLLILLSIPYIIKNTLYTYAEWLTVLFICCLPLLYFKKKNYLFYITLALIPFIRQNLTIACLILFIFIQLELYILKNKINFDKIFVYLFILFIPIYHNIYFANSFTFFNQNIPVVIENANSINDYFSIKWIILNYQNLFDAVFFRFKEILLLDHYKIYDFKNMIENKIISVFVFPMIVYLFYKIYKLDSLYKKMFMIFIFIFSFGPPTILGNQSFPRFEFVNIYLGLTSIFLFNTIDFQKKTI